MAALPPGRWDRLNLKWSTDIFSIPEIWQTFGPDRLPSHLLVEEGYYGDNEATEFNRCNLFLVHAVTNKQGKFVLLCSLVDLGEEEEDYAELDEKPESYDLIFMIPVHVETGATFRVAWRKCLPVNSIQRAMESGQNKAAVPLVDASRLKGSRWTAREDTDIGTVTRDDDDYEIIVDVLKAEALKNRPPVPAPRIRSSSSGNVPDVPPRDLASSSDSPVRRQPPPIPGRTQGQRAPTHLQGHSKGAPQAAPRPIPRPPRQNYENKNFARVEPFSVTSTHPEEKNGTEPKTAPPLVSSIIAPSVASTVQESKSTGEAPPSPMSKVTSIRDVSVTELSAVLRGVRLDKLASVCEEHQVDGKLFSDLSDHILAVEPFNLTEFELKQAARVRNLDVPSQKTKLYDTAM